MHYKLVAYHNTRQNRPKIMLQKPKLILNNRTSFTDSNVQSGAEKS